MQNLEQEIKQELDVEKITDNICGRVVKLISASSACEPQISLLPNVLSQSGQDLVHPVSLENVFSRNSSDASWCLVPARSECMLSCKDKNIVGFWNTLFAGAGRDRSMVFPRIELMMRKNPDELIFKPCPGCMSEITSNICFACDYADKNAFYSDGYWNYSPNSTSSCEPHNTQISPLPNDLGQNVQDIDDPPIQYQYQYDSDEEYMRNHEDSGEEAWT